MSDPKNNLYALINVYKAISLGNHETFTFTVDLS
jgi:hypothetical protein